MAILIDTNIIIELVRDGGENVSNYINPKNDLIYISYVTLAEIQSFAVKLNWGGVKLVKLQNLLDSIKIIGIEEPAILNAYVEIDTFSQGDNKAIPSKLSQNMGKNDLWIAATASVLDITLITTDKDFDHLNGVFLNVIFISKSTIGVLKAQI